MWVKQCHKLLMTGNDNIPPTVKKKDDDWGMVSDIVLPTLIQMPATKVADSNPKKIGFNTMNGNVFPLKWLGMWILVADFKVGLLFFDPFKIAGWPLLLGLMVNKPEMCVQWEDGFLGVLPHRSTPCLGGLRKISSNPIVDHHFSPSNLLGYPPVAIYRTGRAMQRHLQLQKGLPGG